MAQMKLAAVGVAVLLGVSLSARGERLIYHEIRTDEGGKILPWSGPPSQAYDHVVRLVWKFWNGMEKCENGVPYYMQHMIWYPNQHSNGSLCFPSLPQSKVFHKITHIAGFDFRRAPTNRRLQNSVVSLIGINQVRPTSLEPRALGKYANFFCSRRKSLKCFLNLDECWPKLGILPVNLGIRVNNEPNKNYCSRSNPCAGRRNAARSGVKHGRKGGYCCSRKH